MAELADVLGLPRAVRALTIAAAGGHSLLLHGPSGSGKSMLARRLVGLLPDLTDEELAEVTAIERTRRHEGDRRPANRWPHFTASYRAVFGHAHPGECSLAHRGVLVFDELPEFGSSLLAELKCVLLWRATASIMGGSVLDRPACFRFVATMTRCSCGLAGHSHLDRACRCSPEARARYVGRCEHLWPVFDLAVPTSLALRSDPPAPSTAETRAAVCLALDAQRARCEAAGLPPTLNAHVTDELVASWPTVPLAADVLANLEQADRARALRVARTIADLAGEATIDAAHVREALELRELP